MQVAGQDGPTVRAVPVELPCYTLSDGQHVSTLDTVPA